MTGLRAQGDHAIRLVVPFGAGGTTDLLARLIRGPLAQELGRPVVVDNRAGAGGAVGTELVARAAPDGCTLGLATQSTHAANPALNPRLRYDPLRDFVPISMLALVPGVLAVHPTLPATSIAELIALARYNPGKLSYGTPGVGSLGHLQMARFEQLHQVELTHVPYRSAGELLTDALEGRLQVMVDHLPSALPHVRTGKLRALAVTAPRRVPLLPAVATYAELGFGESARPAWFGLVAPASTPPEVALRLNEAVREVMQQPEVMAVLAQSGSERATGSPEEFTLAMRTTLEEFRAVVAARNIRPE
ncbi:MAG TPA: tripartite tricarboxylate transporter substrate binding protein [Albitalea sp.]|uniref:Bug family tripartite tricarboxylate transporter substrate binding protein n=1 Tax=Piscinibacter sp. TaxID=1903157 RepID=UPI002ED0437E